MTTPTTRKRKKPEPKIKFKVGDRVKEINKFQHSLVNPMRGEEYKQKFAAIAASEREGEVIEILLIKNSVGSRRVYVDVLWDGFKTPTRHEQTRLFLLDPGN
jgi:hypothetical protein